MSLADVKDLQNSCVFNCEKLHRARVLLIGAGGLGCAIAVHLAGASVGEIGICDFDTVAQSNLNRQFIYSGEDIGKPKAETAAAYLSRYAPDCTVFPVHWRLDEANAEELVKGFDLVLTACDNTQTRLAANKACTQLEIPLLDCGISGGFGNVYLYIPKISPCLSCVIGGESTDKRTVSAAAGIISGAAAMTALSYLSNGTVSVAGKLILIDTLNYSQDILPIKRTNDCKICGGDCNA